METITLYVVTHKDMESSLPERTYIGVGINKKTKLIDRLHCAVKCIM